MRNMDVSVGRNVMNFKCDSSKSFLQQIASCIVYLTSYVFTGTRTAPEVDTAGMT
jgi:hypothetical protein